MQPQQVYLIRHGETEWSLSGQHTGITDLPLTENGRMLAKRLEPILAKQRFVMVLTSPLKRARDTCELSGLRAAGCVFAEEEARRAEVRLQVVLKDTDGIALSLTPLKAPEIAVAPRLRVAARIGVGTTQVTNASRNRAAL